MIRNRGFWVHFICWFLYLFILTILNYKFPQEVFGVTLSTVIVNLFLIYIGPILIFYLNFFILIPKLLRKRKLILYFSSIPLVILGFYLFDYGARKILFLNGFRIAAPSTQETLAATITFSVLVLGVGSFLRFTSDWFKMDRINEALKREKISAELAFLKSQINPHFLFNTLNNICYLAYEKSDKTPEALIKLAAIMRYMLYDSAEDKVLLNREISYINDFIELQKLRLSYPIPIRIEMEERKDDFLVPPMLLIPFVENAFKHGDTFSEAGFINISLKVNNDEIMYVVENRIKDSSKDETSGIGISNLQRRLEILFPSKYKLITEIIADKYVSTLKIQLV